MRTKEQIKDKLADLEIGLANLSGYSTSARQKQEYKSDYWDELVSLCQQLFGENVINFISHASAIAS